jgi:hypothetical protein
VLAHLASARGVSRRTLGLIGCCILGACATYESTQPDGDPLGSAGSAGTNATAGDHGGGTGGAPVKSGSSGSVATGGASAGGSVGGGGSGMGGALGGMAGSSGNGGSGGTAGAGGRGGSAGAGGVGGAGGSSGGSGGKAGSGGTGGTGGSGGSVSSVTCAKNPIPAKSGWKVTASATRDIDPTTNACDGDLTTRWSSGEDQSGDEWLQLDFGAVVKLSKLTLMLGTSINDYPRKYATRFSNTSMNLAAPVLVSGMGAASTDTVMTFPAGSSGRYVLISQSGTASMLWWSIAEIQAECAD